MADLERMLKELREEYSSEKLYNLRVALKLPENFERELYHVVTPDVKGEVQFKELPSIKALQSLSSHLNSNLYFENLMPTHICPLLEGGIVVAYVSDNEEGGQDTAEYFFFNDGQYYKRTSW
ncbi:MAG: hypothetical protein CL489_10785 [Acidobacteria bacterium]|nr:hypothetical protein [Acidobacteriota bacterium]